MIVQILVDNLDSWIIPYAKKLQNSLISESCFCSLIHHHSDVKKGDVLILLSCEQKFTQLHLNSYNLVVHESYLPQGKGWSPMTWQIVEGKSTVPITLFSASSKIDDGPIFETIEINLKGTELIEEWRELQGEATIKILLNFFSRYPNVTPTAQQGESSFYRKRLPEDSELSCYKTIATQFNKLRVVDNERYPAYFIYKGEKYKVKIEKYE